MRPTPMTWQAERFRGAGPDFSPRFWSGSRGLDGRPSTPDVDSPAMVGSRPSACRQGQCPATIDEHRVNWRRFE